MPALAAILRGRFRLAVATVLALAVLLTGTGAHSTTHCSEHGGGQHHAAVTSTVAELGAPDNGEDGGLCLTCDCTCQTIYQGDALVLQMPASDIGLLVRPEGLVAPDELVIEVEPPPVRVS